MAVDTLLRKFLIPEMIYGNGAHQLTGQYAGRFGISNALVVSDPGVVEVGWTGRIMENLALAGITAVPFTEITPQPKGP
jgi:Alcohol dehydrogenase, class IV